MTHTLQELPARCSPFVGSPSRDLIEERDRIVEEEGEVGERGKKRNREREIMREGDREIQRAGERVVVREME